MTTRDPYGRCSATPAEPFAAEVCPHELSEDAGGRLSRPEGPQHACPEAPGARRDGRPTALPRPVADGNQPLDRLEGAGGGAALPAGRGPSTIVEPTCWRREP